MAHSNVTVFLKCPPNDLSNLSPATISASKSYIERTFFIVIKLSSKYTEKFHKPKDIRKKVEKASTFDEGSAEIREIIAKQRAIFDGSLDKIKESL